ncbi:MAG TPA: SMC family ATPase, partial [Microbacterium sp.]|nr:SMC family ATPase [Microbacterium sp.]
MRLHRLALEGFGPFRERQIVDFDAFSGDGIFLISGRTGAGKSSILDGVCFALYGDAPRYSGSEKRLRSDHCAPDDGTEVQLEFSLGDRRLRVTRSPEYSRPKRRGAGLTPVKQQAQLDEWADGGWVGLASGPRDVGLLLGDVLGLTREQFLQVILLAQGRFAQFLLAGNDERQAVLRTLFGTRRYEDYARALVERRKAAIEGVGEAQRAIEVLLDHAERLAAEAGAAHATTDADATDSDATDAGATDVAPGDAGDAAVSARVESLTRASGRSRHRVETADADVAEAQTLRARAETAFVDGKRTAQAQAELAAERSALAHLEADATAIADARAELDRAGAAESLRATLEVDARRSAELARAQQEERAAREALAAARFDDADADETHLQAAIDEWIGQLAAWQEAEELERCLPDRRRQLDGLSAQLAKTRTERERVDAALAAAPVRSAELDVAIAAAIELAGTEAGLAERIAADDARLTAARELDAIAPRVIDAEAAYAAAAQRAEEGGKGVVQLLQRRLQNHAAELAADLRSGEPCAVCGSPEHPRPADATPDVVTDEHIAAAERERDARRAAESAAQQAAREVRE